MKQETTFIEAFKLAQGDFNGSPLETCANPTCNAPFEQTGITRLEPRRFCCDECRRRGSYIRKTAELLVPLGQQKAWEILSNSAKEFRNLTLSGCDLNGS